ncbi:MAG TPA: FtsK/SpoIIIE domain-containing protein, partial [Phycisphaerales bacterium]|nr:FtsK/SpoIIIE domain-containing protein [Phycisphaerales bacterium]
MQTDPPTPQSPSPATPAKHAATRLGAAPSNPAAAREDAPTLALQRRAVRLLRQAAAETAAARTSLESVYAEKTATAAAARDRALREADGRLAEQRETAESVHAAAVEAAKTAHERGRREAEAMRTRDRDVARERGQRDVEASKQQRDEAVWFAETVLDTDKSKNKAQRQNDKIAIGQMQGRVHLVKRVADEILEKWRQNLLIEVAATPTDSPEPGKLFDEALARAERSVGEMQSYKTPAAIGGLTPWVLVFIAAALGAAAGAAVRQWTIDLYAGVGFLAGAAVGGVAVFMVFRAVRARTRQIVQPLAAALAEAQGALQQQERLFEADDKRRTAEAKAKFEAEAGKARAKHDTTVKKVTDRLADIGARVEEAFAATVGRIEGEHTRAADAARAARESTLNAAEAAAAAARSAAEAAFESETTGARAEYEAGWQALSARWRERAGRVAADLRTIESTLATARTPWTELERLESFTVSPTPTADAATATLDVAAVLAPLENDERLSADLPSTALLSVPLEVPRMGSLALLTPADQRQKATEALSAVMLRMLTTLPPGKARFTIIDPVGLGQSFAGFMRLAEFATTGGSLVGERIWTEPRHIEQKLADITEHMETVIQKYLRNQYPSIDAYNEAAGEVAEPYRFVVIADFPTNVSEIAAKRLESILASGARCGVYVLLAATKKDNLPQGIKWTDVTRACHLLTLKEGQWRWDDADFTGLPVRVPAPPTPEQFSVIADRVGAAAMEASKVRVPFSSIAPTEGDTWTRSTAEGISVPLGRAGATKLQNLALGAGTQQHVLIAGRTGSGKSTLLNVIITASSLWYSPDEIELYLVDFKKGVEFKAYATTRLPHARVIAVESEREFGLSVLRRLDAELTRRGDLFRTAGTQSLAGYRNTADAQVMPRVLLIVDEFQEFFIEDDKLAQEAGLLLDRLVRQGRAFGMHVILGSQTLAGAYSLARSTIGQMGVRVALQCSEADSYLILADDNPAARLLNRPGEAIYNDASGMLEGNNPFQVCWLDEEDRAERITALHERVARMARPLPPAIVFEGNAPAQAEENQEL